MNAFSILFVFPGRPSPPGILGTLLQLSLKEDEIQGHIANLDLEIQALQGMIVDLSHKLNSKKHHRDMVSDAISFDASLFYILLF